ncbi:MAG: AMP-binding protein [Corynebacterium sp.]|nr:AMP-binding protein [Corynebacterium sp.]
MAKYTLKPENDLNTPKSYIARQSLFFLQQLRKAKVLELGSPKDIIQDQKTQKRWGGLEGGILANTARRHPNTKALIDDKGQLTYRELFEQTVRLAHGLQEHGVRDGGNVAVLALNGRDAILPLCARQLLGYNSFMINANSSGPQIQRILEFHEIPTLIVDSNFYDRLTDETKANTDIIIGFEEDGFKAADHNLPTLQRLIDKANVPSSAFEGGHDFLPKKPSLSQHVVMTSGTTGMPKGVVRRMLKSSQGIAPALAAWPIQREMTVLLTAVLFHFYGWGFMIILMLSGSTIVTQRRFDPARVVKEIEEYKITGWASAASRLRQVCSYLDEENIDHVNGLEFIVCSGSKIMPYEVEKVNQKFGRILTNAYGSTETSVLAASNAEQLAADPTLTGIVYPGNRVEIIGEDGKPVPDGEVGEVYTATYDMYAGYTDPSINIPTIDGMHRMGDKGYKKGNKLWVLGRADDLVITQYGEKIFPTEIEDLLIRDDRIHDVHVHGVQDPEYGQALRCYIIRAEGVTKDELSAETVKDLVAQELSEAHAPRDVFFVEDFPRNPMGKVIRPELPGHSTVE